MKSIYEQVESNMDRLVGNQVDWTASATPEQLMKARAGQLSLHFYGREIPGRWLGDLRGKRVLCLAGAGGLQWLGERNRLLLMALR